MASSVEPSDRDFEARVRASFGRQRLMTTIGARLVRVSSGEVEIEAAFSEHLTQQHGFLHAGVITALVDSACGYSALSLAPPDSDVLTVEYKVNFRSGTGRAIRRPRARGALGKDHHGLLGRGRCLTGSQQKQVAVMLATIIVVRATRPDPTS
jgi:uncharacterized protein (TIGR00369 family)